MSTLYPTSKQSVPNPISTDLLENADATLDHDYQHATINDTIEALQDKVGVDGSAVTTTHDYKLSAVTGSAKALTAGTSTQSVTNLTLVTPTLTLNSDATGDMYYRNSGGALTRLPIGTTGQILDVSSGGIPEWIPNPSVADATYSVKGVDYKKANAEYYAVDFGSTDAYAITLTPAPTAYATGEEFSFTANTTNTGTATLNVNSIGAKTIVKGVNTTLADGDILAGQTVTVRFDGTYMVLQSPVAPASTSPYYGIFKSLTGTQDVTSTTTSTIAHGLGVAPKNARITFQIPFNGSTKFATSIGTYNGSTQNCIYFASNANGAVQSSGVASKFVHLGWNTGGTGSDYLEGVASWDATNVTITWTKTGTTSAGTFDYLLEVQA